MRSSGGRAEFVQRLYCLVFMAVSCTGLKGFPAEHVGGARARRSAPPCTRPAGMAISCLCRRHEHRSRSSAVCLTASRAPARPCGAKPVAGGRSSSMPPPWSDRPEPLRPPHGPGFAGNSVAPGGRFSPVTQSFTSLRGSSSLMTSDHPAFRALSMRSRAESTVHPIRVALTNGRMSHKPISG